MKASIIYATRTGHSKKIAKAIAKGLGIEALNIKDFPVLEETDLLFIVGGIYGGKSSPQLLEYLKTLVPNKIGKAVLITSAGSLQFSQTDVRQALTKQGIPVATEEYRCRGRVFIYAMGHPSKAEIEAAVEFALKKASQ
jgi:flavodoxin